MPILSELKKALTTSGDGAALVPYDLDPMLHEELLKLQPLAQILSIIQAESKTHEYNARTSHPLAWFEGENTPANNKTGVYQRKNVMLKIQRIWGSVTGFAQKVDEKFINALAEEVTGSLEGMANVFEYGVLWGTSNDIGYTGDAYQYSGLIPRIFKYAPQNVVDGGSNKIGLDELDSLIAKIARHRQTRNDPRLFMMGLEMKQVVDGLQTKVQLPLREVTLADGRVEMDAYGRTPIFETDFLVPEASTTSPTVAGTIGAGGALPAATYQYKLASVTVYGEQVAGAASGNIISASTNNTANLTWTPDANAVEYMLFRNEGGGTFYLLDIIPALTYDADGKVNGTVAAYADTGAKTISTIKPLAAGEENVLAVNINPARGLAFLGMIDDMGRQVDSLTSFVELARVKDSYDYMLKSYLAARLVYPNLASVLRHVKKA
jgi:hypothetical protein